jgi:molybdate transport system regulatory protein
VCLPKQRTAARISRIRYLHDMARVTLRLDFAPGQSIGHGKIRLLEAVREHGSISAAGRSIGMSYRRAWLLIDDLNGMFDQPVIQTKHGGVSGGGAELTSLGHRLIQNYRAMEGKALAAVNAELAEVAANITRRQSRSRASRKSASRLQT